MEIVSLSSENTNYHAVPATVICIIYLLIIKLVEMLFEQLIVLLVLPISCCSTVNVDVYVSALFIGTSLLEKSAVLFDVKPIVYGVSQLLN